MILTDVAVIGGGLAGMSAAIEADAGGADVLLIDRTTFGLGTNSALSNGVFAGPTAGYSPDRYIDDTLRIGKNLNALSSVHLVAREVPASIRFLRSAGVEIEEKKDHYFVASPNTGEIPGARLVRQMAARVSRLRKIGILGNTLVTDLLVEENRIVGCRGFRRDGSEVTVFARSVVLASGGAGALYMRNDNQKSTLGQGYYLAAKAGLELRDLEFVQYYPVVLAEPRLPTAMLHSPHPEEARIINAAGEDIAEKYGIADLNHAIRNQRDRLGAILFEEGRAGAVYMDYRRIPASLWNKHPLNILSRRKFDFRSKPVMISPAAHYLMGGIPIDESARTSIEGLFACGEVAWGLHGACRKGGNALSECVVFGRIAGRNAAARISAGRKPVPAKSIGRVRSEGSPKGSAANPAEVRSIRQSLKSIAWHHAGVVRDREGLEEGLRQLSFIESRLTGLETDAWGKHDLLSMAFVLKAILTASLFRRESRGCLIRSDYPEQNDGDFLKSTCIGFDGPGGGFLPETRKSEIRISKLETNSNDE